MYIHTVVDNKCKTLLLLAKGKFHGPVAEQTRSKKNAVVQFWRRKELFTLEMKKITLYINRKKGINESEGLRICCKNILRKQIASYIKIKQQSDDSYEGLGK